MPSISHKAYTVFLPEEQTVPLLFSSPHSGQLYSAAFLQQSALPLLGLRSTEDTFVDELFSISPEAGAVQLAATFPRCYVDPNRAIDELDVTMFDGDIGYAANKSSLRVKSGLGVIPRVNLQGEPIYASPLPALEVAHRLENYYKPYHAMLKKLIQQTKKKFGFCVLIDCHSMPSVGGPIDEDKGQPRVNFVLGDYYAKSCAPVFSRSVATFLRRQGYAVQYNMPYAGGFITQHYGDPAKNVHVLQIEVCRSLYMNEQTMEKTANFTVLQTALSGLVQHLSAGLSNLENMPLAAE